MKLKSPTTYIEQVAKLKFYGFIIEDETKLIDFLNQANYYRLTAYMLPFKDKNHNYQAGIPMLRIKALYDFDSELRNWIFQIIEHIELYLRTQLAYYIAHTYGPEAYMNKSMYSSRHNHDVFLENFERCIYSNRRSLVVQHHKQKYEGRFPIWVAIEYFSAGMLSFLVSDLHKRDMKKFARESFNTDGQSLSSWLKALTDLRNRCAHYNRLYYWSFVSAPRNNRMNDKEISWEMDRTLFSQIMMLKELYPNKQLWNMKFIPDLIIIISKYINDIEFEHIGFPEKEFDPNGLGWKEYLSK